MMLRKHGDVESPSFVTGYVPDPLSGVRSCVVGVGIVGPNAPNRQISHSVTGAGAVAMGGTFSAGWVATADVVSAWCTLVLVGAIAAKLLHGSNTCPLGATSRAKETVPGDSALSRS